jgi:hypothetical protein
MKKLILTAAAAPLLLSSACTAPTMPGHGLNDV